MEKNRSLSNGNGVKDSLGLGRSVTEGGNNNKGATDCYSWEKFSTGGQDSLGVGDGGGDLLDGFSWPPRSYTCTFCKREFRSAQALGGHMNVHRRDRARLRQISPPSRELPLPPLQNFPSNNNLLNLNLAPNPNPNFSVTSPSTVFAPFISSSKLPPLISPSHSSLPTDGLPQVPSHNLCPRSANLADLRSHKPLFGVGGLDGFTRGTESKMVKKSEMVRLNLEIGFLGETKSEDLDLELRLGCS